MRLIRTAHPIKLGEFWENEVANLKYAILSHRWEEDELSFQEMTEQTEKIRQKKGYRKIARFCERARNDGFQYVWVDTCCINKESSAELSGAINSMFRWYLESARCYAYLSDLSSRDQLADSVWFTRGWTLQELVAPREMFFLDKTWTLIGSRNEICSELENITKIDTSLLLGKSRLEQFSIAKRMLWAATRETTRTEDRAYSLLGLFYVNMPLLYGEGNNAFIRLQEEIMRNSNDETLFAWESEDVSTENPCGFFARSPRDFANSGDIFPISFSSDATPCTATNRGIRIQSPLLPPHSEATTLVLQCSSGDGVLGIGLMSKPGTNNNEDFIRVTGCLQRQVQFDLLFGAVLDTVYIPKTFVGTPMSTKVTCSPSCSDDLSRERTHNVPSADHYLRFGHGVTKR
ncbi:hypothetical protein PENSTE_c001G09143 [Penicillium steckii]|uniref:Uncharacterized protein n=1 Tax=Penicillium steckii TaxID=303698 RepID=A0A1V6U2J0_9EURO|nr:hypothetical protein PENSTE_c001G09143 [Penicillium steckii]